MRKKGNARSEGQKARWAREKEKAMEQSTGLDETIETARPNAMAEALKAKTANQTAHLTPRSDPEAVRMVERAEKARPNLTPKAPPPLDPEILAARMRDRHRAPPPPPERPAPVSDPEREGARRAEEIRRANFRAMMEADERERGPQGPNPRVPMQAVPQTFRRRNWADPPPNKDGQSPVPAGHIPQWVTTESTAGDEPRPSMATINDFLDYGYTYVRDDQNEVIVTTNGVLMSATPEVWAARQAHLEPQGAFSTRDLDGKGGGARRSTTTRYDGRAIATITEQPEHGRGYEREQVAIPADDDR